MPTPKWFTVATEGQTSDGRTIERQWLADMAASYDRKKYGARIWLEHIKGILPDSPFKAYGDVLALRTTQNAEGLLQLQAQIDPTPELVALARARQKIYTSIEMAPNFAQSGKAGLVGLGITDIPASLGTDILKFSAQHPEASPFAGRKAAPENLLTVAVPVAMTFTQDDEDADGSEAGGGLLAAMTEAFRKIAARANPTAQPAPASDKPDEIHNTLVEFATASLQAQQALAERVAALQRRLDGLDSGAFASAADFNALRELLAQTDANAATRALATGGDGTVHTDC